MKKILIVCSLFLSFLANAQEGGRKNLIKVNPLSALVSTGSFFYERKISSNTSLQLGAFYSGCKVDDLKMNGLGITPEFRYYTSKKGNMEGLYLASFLRYQNYELTELGNKGRLNTYGGGLLVGKQWIYSKGFSLDLFAGPSYSAGNTKITSGKNSFNLPNDADGFCIRAGITVGIVF